MLLLLLAVGARSSYETNVEVVWGPSHTGAECIAYSPSKNACIHRLEHPDGKAGTTSALERIAAHEKVTHAALQATAPVMLKLSLPLRSSDSLATKQRLARKVALDMQRVCNESICSNTRPSPSNVNVAVDVSPEGNATSAALTLAGIGAVTAVDTASPYTLFNAHESAIIQGALPSSSEQEQPLHNAGFTGSGSVIGIVDDGLDMEHCLFKDSDHSSAGPEHRKVVADEPLVGKSSNLSAHGTAIAASAAGACEEANGNNDCCAQKGIAPEAKLAFLEASVRMPNGSLVSETASMLAALEDISTPFKALSNMSNAFISVNSYGTFGSNDADANELDSFVHSPGGSKSLLVFAAGNAGNNSNLASMSVQAAAKNVLAVGATYGDDHMQLHKTITNKREGGAFLELDDENLRAEVPAAALKLVEEDANVEGVMKKILSTNLEIHVSGAESQQMEDNATFVSGCDPEELPDGDNSETRHFALVDGFPEPSCNLEKKVSAAMQKENLDGLLLAGELNAPVGLAQTSYNVKNDTELVVAFMTRKRADELQQVARATDGALKAKIHRGEHKSLHEIAVPSFSSKGPSIDGRLKPDIVAPGVDVTTADSNSTCASTQQSGTSYAASFAAGASAIVRQHLIDEHGVTQPSSALVKAAIINGAKTDMHPYEVPSSYLDSNVSNLHHGRYAWLPIDQPPSNQLGWGFLWLPRALSKVQANEGEDLDGIQQDLIAFDEVTLDNDTKQQATFHLLVHDEELRVTLAYADPASAVAGASPENSLVNDLDLIVSALNGSHFQRPLLQADRRNNVERVRVPKPADDANPVHVQVNVTAVDLPGSLEQECAIVVTGNVTQISELQYIPGTKEEEEGGEGETGAGSGQTGGGEASDSSSTIDERSSNNGGAIAGAIIGIVGGAALIYAVYWFFGEKIKEKLFGTYTVLADRV